MPGYIYRVILIGILLQCFSMPAVARDTVFQSGYELAGYGGPEILYTRLNNQNTVIIGGKGVGLWGNDLYAFSLGVAGYATPGRLNLSTDRNFNLAYGGMTVGYSRNPGDMFHWRSDAFLGAGSIWVTDNTTSLAVTSGNILVLELSAGADVNLTNHLQIGIGTSWRIISNPQIEGLTGKSLSGLGLKINIEFGQFD